MSFIQELLRMKLTEEEPESADSSEEVVNAKDLDVDDEVHNKLKKAAETDDVETQCFGLEMEDGKVVKVYVAIDDAEEFEKAMADKLGEDDNIKTALEELDKDFDIVDVIWPEGSEEAKEGDESEEDDEEDLEADEETGKASLNKDVDYDDAKKESKTVGQSFAARLLELDWTNAEVDAPKAKTPKAKEVVDDEEAEANPQDEDDKPADISFSSGTKWTIKKDKKGMTLSNEFFRVDLDINETLELVNKMTDKKIARFKNEDNNVTYVFSPRGNDYILKTPEYQSGFKIGSDIIEQIIE